MSSPFRTDPTCWKNRRAAILGLGRSGMACAKLLHRKGFRVFASEIRPASEMKPALRQLPARVEVETGRHSPEVLRCDFLVKSPGTLPHLDILQQARRLRIPIFSELEVGLAFLQTRCLLAVTGTNGKSTTVALAGEILSRSGRRVEVAGNIGRPVSAVALENLNPEILLLEVSSYQLEDSLFFHPHGAAILNILPEHLDHHRRWSRYLRAKARIFLGQRASDFCLFNRDDPATLRLSRLGPSQRLYFSSSSRSRAHAFIHRQKLILRRNAGKPPVALPFPKHLFGPHNLENALAACAMSLRSGASLRGAQEALRRFPGLPHRLEFLGAHRGIRIYNDSKATNVASTLTALRSFRDCAKNIWLILGGLDKGQPYRPLQVPIRQKVKEILLIGEAAQKIQRELGSIAVCRRLQHLERAVSYALRCACVGDILLLSPACASFDQFRDYEDRGERFKNLVAKHVR
ncbi:MAG: UDP-N-acetylmuramoyl-L-alanine--D-glutamate ligase [Elusimicrobia bacterium]|nr:UDP-N-acetylmuramoyl-L-alanine--D-glutamate ligase [Elusimicrobiota bacterium]